MSQKQFDMKGYVKLPLKNYKELLDFKTRFIAAEHKKILSSHWDSKCNIFLEIISDNEAIKILSETIKDYDIRIGLLRKEINHNITVKCVYNCLPWYIRIFKKV